MAAGKGCFVVSIAFLLFFLVSVCCLPEPGKKDLHFKMNQTLDIFAKTMNKGYSIAIGGSCQGVENVNIMWRLYVTQCAESFSSLKTRDQNQLYYLWDDTGREFSNHSLSSEQKTVSCKTVIHLPDLTDKVNELIISAEESNEESKQQEITKVEASLSKKKTKGDSASEDAGKDNASTPKTNSNKDSKSGSVNRRSVVNEGNEEESKQQSSDGEKEASLSKEKAPPTATKEEKDTAVPPSKTSSSELEKKGEKTSSSDEHAHVKNQVCATKRDGVFLLIVEAKPDDDKKDNFKLTLNVEMKGQHGYLSASDWPLYPFYGCMSLLYVFYGIVWLIVSACQWRDLLRIQFWIGGVIALGMLEKAVFFSEYNNINITGETNPGLTVFAELVSCVKRTLARILVIIVSMGFGIVKPRLGTTLHRVLGVGALYFILATVEGCFRSLHPKSDPGKQQLIASIPLAVLDASICWWIFMSLVQTTRTLRIRRNLVKLSLYRHFTNTLIFAVLASVAYMIWSIKTHRFAKDGCITNWSELWLDEAFWHFLFSIVLLVIMVLWRPTANNQRYAFTPIVDFGDDDDDDENMTLSDAFDGMKMRNVKNTPEVMINGDTKRKHKPEDDLKWVEENIPSSAADAVLPSVLDSDEELMTTKFEMSKME